MPVSSKAKAKRGVFFAAVVCFFCFFPRFSYAAPPLARSISPVGGLISPDTARTFSCAYSDKDGWANLKEAYLLISTSPANLTNSVYLYYDQNTNLLYLRNDANTAWLGGYAPKSAKVVENSQVKLNCNASTVSTSSAVLTVKFNLTFKPAYAGKTYNTYLYITDDTGGYTGWTKKGTWSIKYMPQLGTITPSSGTGQLNIAQVFSAVYSASASFTNIRYAYFLMNTSLSYANCLYAYYDQNNNKLYLRNDANTSWLGGYEPGSNNLIENSYAKLDCSQTIVSGANTTLTINWPILIKAPFTGAKNTYLAVTDDFNVPSGFVQKGSWIIPNHAPSSGTVSPAEGTSAPGQTLNFTAVYADEDTWINIKEAHFLLNSSILGKNCLYAYYNQDTNKLYLRNDADTTWLGGYSPGSSKVIENTYVKLNCALSKASGAGNSLSLTWSVTFKDKFSGVKNMYLYVKDDAGADQAWTQKGDFCIFRTPISPPD